MNIVSDEILMPGGGLTGSDPDLVELARAVRIHSTPFINGKFVDARSDDIYSNPSPITGSVLNEISLATAADVDSAVKAARAAFDDGRWWGLAPGVRKERMLAFRDLVQQHARELAMLDALDVGKPFGAALSVDIADVISALGWYGEAIDKVYGQVAPTVNLDVIVREPLGVVAAVVPWNYPLMIAGWKVAPSLAAGNSVILKPAEQSPLSALRLAELAVEAGIPDGVLNVLPGDGSVGEALGRHAGVDGVAFTGSTAVGKRFLSYAGESTIKVVSLECGGKSAAIVCEDADIDAAASGIAGGLFYNAGQSCNAPTRVLVHRKIVDELTRALAVQAPAYAPDNPLASGAVVGSVVSAEQLARIEGFVAQGVKDGAEVVVGGHRLYEHSGGSYYEPTLLLGAQRDMSISQEEIFGPVLPIEVYDDLSSAVDSANSVAYGLWGSVWTNSLEASVYVTRRLRAGTVAVNNAFGGDMTTPLGGMKQSGTGRDRSLEALMKYTHTKHWHFNV